MPESTGFAVLLGNAGGLPRRTGLPGIHPAGFIPRPGASVARSPVSSRSGSHRASGGYSSPQPRRPGNHRDPQHLLRRPHRHRLGLALILLASFYNEIPLLGRLNCRCACSPSSPSAWS
jgi:hypothetical protein